MKMSKRVLVPLGVLSLVLLLALNGCKKKKEFKSEDGQSCVDNQNIQGENDAAISDANAAMGDQNLLSGRNQSSSEKSTKVLGTICGMSVDTSEVTSGILYLNYNGTVCNNRKREGKIKLKIQGYPLVKWKQANCVLILEYINFKITRASDGKSILLNGTVTVTNESGGTWIDLLFFNKPSLIHVVKGSGIKVKFDGSKSAEYNIHRRYTYTFDIINLVPIVTVKGEGLGTNDGISHLENWGTTRDGDAFTSQVNAPIIWNTTCGSGAPIQGELIIRVAGKDFELNCLFGVNSSGNSMVVQPNTCAYGWKMNWKYKKKTKERIFPYK